MEPGSQIAHRYQIIRLLGEGGTASVYLARDLQTGRDVSVKLLRVELENDASSKRRFKQDARRAINLTNEHIVNLLDAGEADGQPFIVMEYVPGTDLKHFLKLNHPLPITTAVQLMQQIVEGMVVAHQHGVIHRDLKPQNILVGADNQIKITDFGIATALGQNELTQTNSLVGSIHYLSPEQGRGGLATPQSDVYALGIILFELLTGQVPFQGENAIAIALKHFQTPMPSMRDWRPEIPQSLDNVVQKATAKQPRDRYHDASEMAADLATVLNKDRAREPKFAIPSDCGDVTRPLDVNQIRQATAQLKATPSDETLPKQPVASPTQQSRHRKWPWLVGALLLVLGLIGGGIYWYFNQTITVPDVAGESLESARQSLASRQLKVGDLHHRYSKQVAAGDVIAVNGPTKRHRGQQVDLTVSRGVESYQIGYYTGERYRNVAESLRKKGFVVHRETQYSADYERGVVIKQSLPIGEIAHPGSDSITLTVSAGKDEVKLPNFKNQSVDQVLAFANRHGLPLTIMTTHSDTVANNHVVSQQVKAGHYLTRGDSLVVTIASETDAEKTTNVQLTIPYDKRHRENQVQIYVRDMNHNYRTPYQTMTITSDQTITLPLKLKNNSTGSYRVVRDGRTILSANNIN